MYIGDIEDCFDANENEFKKFQNVENKSNRCRDIHVLLLLQKTFDIYLSVLIYIDNGGVNLNVDMSDDKNLEKFTEELILELVQCGVRYDSKEDCLVYYV